MRRSLTKVQTIDTLERCPRDYDMHDSSSDLAQWPGLESRLSDCAATVVKAYSTADSASLRDQAVHKWLVFIAALCGMIAVLAAIMQLTPLDPLQEPWVKVSEIVSAIIAVVAVALGLLAAISTGWLLDRERAERYRFIKFQFLTSPELWSDASNDYERQQWLRNQVKSLRNLDKKGMKEWAEEDYEAVETANSAQPPKHIDESILEQLVDYYIVKRITCQQQYFDRQAQRRQRWDKFTRIAPVALFFLSILFALAHFLYVLRFGHLQPEQDTIGVTLLIAAACLPVVGAAIRTLRTAHEFGRNALRFRAVAKKLRRFTQELQGENNAEAKLLVIRRVEAILKAEHREWMRLMGEAEWFA